MIILLNTNNEFTKSKRKIYVETEITLYNYYQNTVVIKVPSVYMYRIEEIDKF